MVTVQGIEIPVRAQSRDALIGRLEHMLGELIERVSVSELPVGDRLALLDNRGIRHIRSTGPATLN